MTNKRTSQPIKEEKSTDEDLKAEINNLKKQLDLLTKAIGSKEEKKQEEKEISPTDYIRVMSLCDCEMCLSTRPRGQGKMFNFRKYGEVKRIFYSDLLEIINNHTNLLEGGYFYILNEAVIKANSLEETYEKILDKDQIEKVMNSSSEAASLFESANTKQRELIIEMLVSKVRDGKKVDYNLISEITRISGINIIEKANEAKRAMEVEK